jgi:uncharacterized membrane protein YecN with MAPEG domain
VPSVLKALHATFGNVRQDRRLSRSHRAATALSDDVSSGGAIFYCDLFISPHSDVGLVIVLPLEIAQGKPVQVWCLGKVLRVGKELKDSKFRIAVEFTTFQVLPSG